MEAKDIPNRCKLHLQFSWLSKSQYNWYVKTYDIPQWLHVVRRSRKLQIIQRSNEHLTPEQIFYKVNDTMLEVGVKPTHLVPIFIIAGEPWSELYFQNLGQPGFLPKEDWRYRQDYYSGYRLNYTEVVTDWVNEL